MYVHMTSLYSYMFDLMYYQLVHAITLRVVLTKHVNLQVS